MSGALSLLKSFLGIKGAVGGKTYTKGEKEDIKDAYIRIWGEASLFWFLEKL